jgi:hypothetical protein
MKLIIAGILSLFALTANAGGIDCRSGVDHKNPLCYSKPHVVHVQHRGHHLHNRHWHHRHAPVIIHRHHDNWVAPLVGGVILGAVIADANAKDREDNQQKRQVCTEWKEIITEDGKIYKERTCKEL